jgi:hypothetical protein
MAHQVLLFALLVALLAAHPADAGCYRGRPKPLRTATELYWNHAPVKRLALSDLPAQLSWWALPGAAGQPGAQSALCPLIIGMLLRLRAPCDSPRAHGRPPPYALPARGTRRLYNSCVPMSASQPRGWLSAHCSCQPLHPTPACGPQCGPMRPHAARADPPLPPPSCGTGPTTMAPTG